MIYVRFADGSLGRYEGMSQATVTALLAGKTYDFIDEATYAAELAAKQDAP